MECLYKKQCGKCVLSRDPVNNVIFADEQCRDRYYQTKQAVRDATSFDSTLFDALWFIHVALTRQVILSVLHDAPNTQWQIAELLANQADLGKLLGLGVMDTQFGQAAQKLLETHIVQAKGLLEALIGAAGGDLSYELKLDRLFVTWNDNGREIVAALASRLLKKEQSKERQGLDDAMLRHLSLTYSEMKHAVAGDDKESLHFYDETLHCIADMSRTISGLLI